ncbi:hypothetical protein NECAME_03537 [Necator americanus]|uniref:Major facilitator superfamily (MFS) profile domain-containing protein n=1 Tax=Necator americanus TaxID=51031 RepID=W2T3N3_NECAM|nr:hypothetical protein NECAME_03537 [Necator americanus]ETN76164.1 hypothetical protein NECAME_03537 [Necator americanus]
MHMMQFALAQAHEVTVHERAYLHAEAGINPKLCRVELVKLGSKGTFSFGAASDIFGRKPVAIVAFSIGVFTNFITAYVVDDLLTSQHIDEEQMTRNHLGLAPTWQVLMAIRFFVGLSVGGTLVVVCTFVMEMLLPQQRMALRAFFNWVTMVSHLMQWITGRLEEMRIAERYIARFARIEYKPVAHKKIEHNKGYQVSSELLHFWLLIY